MSDFGHSFSFFIGTPNKELDWFDNPYIEANVYEVTGGWKPMLSKNISLRKCDPEEDFHYIAPTIRAYYPNSLCFVNLKSMHMFGNWFDDEFSNYYV